MNRGEKLKKLRKDKGLTQKQVLEDLKQTNKQIDKNTLSNAEKNENISNTTMEILAWYYDVSLDYLKKDEINNITNENIEINKAFGFSDITISKLKELEYKKDLNILFEKINFSNISHYLRNITILKNYYDICRALSLRNYDFIKSIDINTIKSIYLFEDVSETLKTIISNIKKGNKINIEKIYYEVLMNFMNRINESIGFYKYNINKEISHALDEIFSNAVAL